MKTLKRLWRLFSYFFRAYPKRSSLVCMLMLLAGLAEGIGMASLLPLLNIVLAPSDGGSELNRTIESYFNSLGIAPTAGTILLVVVALISAKSLLVLLAMTQAGYAANRVAANMRLQLVRALMSARWSYFIRQRTGNLTAALGAEPSRAALSYIGLCRTLVAMVQALAYTILAATISFPITVSALVIGGISAALLNRLVRLGARAGQEQTKLQRRFLSVLIDSLGAMKPIKATASEERVAPLLERYATSLKGVEDRLTTTSEALRNLQEPIRVAAAAAGFFILLSIWTDRTDTLIMLTLLFLRTVDRLGLIQRYMQLTLNNQAAFWFVFSVIKHATRAAEERSGGAPPSLEKGIDIQGISFAYSKNRIIDDLTLTIPVRTMVSLVGRSGSGKSTLADLLTGLQRPEKGEILIDDSPLSELDLEAWRRMIGYVPQETVLFHDTILANVTLGDPALGREAAAAALKRAEAWDFVSEMPGGLDTVVGERGGRLSGGQRQRIALARALVRNPKLLILDEATSALDPETERSICATLRHLSGELTILAISHNQALVDIADRVYELHQGTLTARSDSEALSAQ